MLLRALRVWGALLLVALVACPARTADAATRTHHQPTKTRVAAGKTSVQRAKRARARKSTAA
jgi:hypothetical protein